MIDLTNILGTYAPIPILTTETQTILTLDINYIVRAVILLMGLKFIFSILLQIAKCIQR